MRTAAAAYCCSATELPFSVAIQPPEMALDQQVHISAIGDVGIAARVRSEAESEDFGGGHRLKCFRTLPKRSGDVGRVVGCDLVS